MKHALKLVFQLGVSLINGRARAPPKQRSTYCITAVRHELFTFGRFETSKGIPPEVFFQGEIKLANISRKKFFLAVNVVHGKDMVKLQKCVCESYM